MKKMSVILSILALMFLAIFWLDRSSRFRSSDQAEAFYLEGKKAATVSERKQALNAALAEFLLLEKSGLPDFGTGKLYYDIGNTYFLLEDYPNAIYYYVKAKGLMPRSESVVRNLSAARDKLSLPPLERNGWLDRLLLDKWIPLPKRLQLFALLAAITTGLLSVSIWQGKKLWRRLGVFFLFLTVLSALNLAATRYLSPIEAVVLKGEFPLREAGAVDAKAGTQPLPAGTVVEVIEATPDGKWVKVVPEEGSLGFVPAGSVRLVR